MKTVTLLFVLTSTLVGCGGTAQMVRKDATGGRVALQGPFMLAMSQARELMVEHCRGRFETIEQGESVLFRCQQPLVTAGAVQVSANEHGAKQGL